jgi:predicted small metal-binding protein
LNAIPSVAFWDEKEIVEIAVQHAEKSHNMKITEKDAKEMMKDAA